jgi:hypothetical protein
MEDVMYEDEVIQIFEALLTIIDNSDVRTTLFGNMYSPAYVQNTFATVFIPEVWVWKSAPVTRRR